MKHLSSLVTLIEQANLAVAGTDLFIESMPEGKTQAVMLRGKPGGDRIDRGQEGFYDTYFSLVVRDTHPETAYNRCEQIANCLQASYKNMPHIYIVYMYPMTKPQVFPMGESDLVEAACDIQIAYGA